MVIIFFSKNIKDLERSTNLISTIHALYLIVFICILIPIYLLSTSCMFSACYILLLILAAFLSSLSNSIAIKTLFPNINFFTCSSRNRLWQYDVPQIHFGVYPRSNGQL